MACEFAACISENGCIEAIPTGTNGQVLQLVGGVPVWADPVISPLAGVLAAGNTIGNYTNENGDVVNILETITALTNPLAAGNAIGTYTNENGDAVNLFETITTLANVLAAGNAIGTYTNENGDVVNLFETVTTLAGVLPAGNTIGTYTNEDGTNVTIRETITTLTENPDGTLTYTSEDGTAVVVAPQGVVTTLTNVLAAGNILGTYTNENGDAVSIRETVTTLVANADGSFTYTNEDGTAVNVPAAVETVTTLVVNADGSFTYTNEAGAVVNVPAANETVTTLAGTLAAGNVIGTYTNEAAAAVPIRETVTTLVVNANGTLTYTNEAGVVVNTPAAAETVTTLVANADGSFTYTNEAGAVVNVPAACPAIAIDTANTCAAGGTGADYALRSATFNQATCTLTLNGAPEHYTICEELFDTGAVFTPPVGGEQRGARQEVTITNPSDCRTMHLLITANNPTWRLTGNPAGFVEGAGWLEVFEDGALITPAASRVDAFAQIPAALNTAAGFTTTDFGGSMQTYCRTLAPGATVTIGLEWVAFVFSATMPTTMAIGVGNLTIFGSTTN